MKKWGISERRRSKVSWNVKAVKAEKSNTKGGKGKKVTWNPKVV